jgi:hypothetical protein
MGHPEDLTGPWDDTSCAGWFQGAVQPGPAVAHQVRHGFEGWRSPTPQRSYGRNCPRLEILAAVRPAAYWPAAHAPPITILRGLDAAPRGSRRRLEQCLTFSPELGLRQRFRCRIFLGCSLCHTQHHVEERCKTLVSTGLSRRPPAARLVETLSQTTPLMRKHLNPFGRYHFDLDRMRQTVPS